MMDSGQLVSTWLSAGLANGLSGTSFLSHLHSAGSVHPCLKHVASIDPWLVSLTALAQLDVWQTA